MTSNSPHPNSLSPSKPPTSAFQWPYPPSPSKAVAASNNDITVKEILDRYNEDPDLLKYILTAKSEEDKKKAARDTLKAEEARIQLRRMDLEYAREQAKRHAYPQQYIHPQPAPVQPVAPPNQPYPYYGLAPVQQQVLARFNYPPQYGQQGQHAQPPPSPSVPYPHSAHPLCPPSNTERLHKISPTSPIQEEKSLKRNRSSVSSAEEQPPLSHNKVMEALKAKIQRSNGGPPSPSPLTSTKKRKALPRPVVVNTTSSSSTPSPRSAKPILPPIDTNLGRINMPTKPTTEHVIKKDTHSPSDHILLNTRRARSLSASSSSSSPLVSKEK